MDRRFHLIPLGIMPWEWLLMIPDMEPWRKWMRKNKHSMSIKQKEPMRKRYLILNSFHTTFIFQWYTGCICIIDQGWSQHGGILVEFSFCVFMDQDKVEVHKNRKKNKAASHIQPSWPKIWSIKDLFYSKNIALCRKSRMTWLFGVFVVQ